MGQPRPPSIPVRCLDDHGAGQLVRIDSRDKDGMVWAQRGGGATLGMTARGALLAASAFSIHSHWLLGPRHSLDRQPGRFDIDCTTLDGQPELLLVWSSASEVLALRAGGLTLHFDVRGAVHASEALLGHARWVLPRWVPA
jgi:hypothetical protein